MKINLPDGNQLELDHQASGRDVAQAIGAGLAKAAIGVKVDGTLLDIDQPLNDGDTVSIITAPRIDKKGRAKYRDDDHQKDALYLLRHSCAHVMAEAIERIWPDTQLAYGPPLENGFYYDLQLDTPISSDDFEKIEAEMAKIVAEDRPFVRHEMDVASGMEKLQSEGNKYKIDNAERAVEGGAESLSWYVTGEAGSNWEDLCQGPHVPATGQIGGFKIMSIASSHWHGDIESDRFQRVYGTAFFAQSELDEYLHNLEEARKRDHRVIGRQLGLYEIDDVVGQGLVLWKPKGAILRDELQKFIIEHLVRQGYSQVFTPHIGKLDLFRTSGHFPYYQDSQYPPIVTRDTMTMLADEGNSCGDLSDLLRAGNIDGYMLKPMNCPFHVKIYDSEPRSYRDLPIRLFEFGTVYRWEQSGELGGMTRVRGFTQDDAHLFVREDQLDDEVAGCLELVKIVFNTLGMSDYRVRVGLRDPDSEKYVGDAGQWDKAEAACMRAAESLGKPFVAEAGEAAFYGPKIDFVVKDVIGREWQLGTVQIDYQMPERFDLWYVGKDNEKHRPMMIHRAPFGSMERFVAVLIEHFAGAFPLWLSPEQVRVLPISDKFIDYADKVFDACKAAGLRVTVDDSSDRVNGKIRTAQNDKVPYMLIVGGRDEEAGNVSVRARENDRGKNGELGALALEEFVEKAVAEVASKGEAMVG